MRRAVAIVLGTATGTALLVGAKLGNASSGAVALDGDAGGVVVSGSGAAGAQPSVGRSSPSGMATAGTPTSVPTAGKPSAPKFVPTASRPAPTSPSGPKGGTYSGSAPVHGGRYGTLSMSVTISGGKIASISASENGGETNCYRSACNTLKPEALQAQSANISSVSGATYSSAAFKTTLQAVLNSAKA